MRGCGARNTRDPISLHVETLQFSSSRLSLMSAVHQRRLFPMIMRGTCVPLVIVCWAVDSQLLPTDGTPALGFGFTGKQNPTSTPIVKFSRHANGCHVGPKINLC